MKVYQEYGCNSREEYLEGVAESFGLPLDTVRSMAEILGPDEDFDGLITSLDDYSETLEDSQ